MNASLMRTENAVMQQITQAVDRHRLAISNGQPCAAATACGAIEALRALSAELGLNTAKLRAQQAAVQCRSHQLHQEHAA